MAYAISHKINRGLSLKPLSPDYQPKHVKAWFDPKLEIPGYTTTAQGTEIHSIPTSDRTFLYIETDGSPVFCQMGDRVLLNRLTSDQNLQPEEIV